MGRTRYYGHMHPVIAHDMWRQQWKPRRMRGQLYNNLETIWKGPYWHQGRWMKKYVYRRQSGRVFGPVFRYQKMGHLVTKVFDPKYKRWIGNDSIKKSIKRHFEIRYKLARRDGAYFPRVR